MNIIYFSININVFLNKEHHIGESLNILLVCIFSLTCINFHQVPITDFSIPIRGLENWFETIVVTRKREDISKLIKKLVATYNADNLPLPDIIFPTLNGEKK